MEILTQDLETAGFNFLLFCVLPEGLYVKFEKRTSELCHEGELGITVSEVSHHMEVSVKDYICGALHGQKQLFRIKVHKTQNTPIN